MSVFGRKRIGAAMAAGVFAVGFSLAAAGPASASMARPTTCPAGWLCLFDPINYNGSAGKFTQSENSLKNWSHASCPSGTWDNCASSVYNDTGNCWQLHDAYNGAGGYHNLRPHDGYPNLASAAYNNVISSIIRTGSTGTTC